jgi:hypothetical protein
MGRDKRLGSMAQRDLVSSKSYVARHFCIVTMAKDATMPVPTTQPCVFTNLCLWLSDERAIPISNSKHNHIGPDPKSP